MPATMMDKTNHASLLIPVTRPAQWAPLLRTSFATER